jgi:GTP-binding protein
MPGTPIRIFLRSQSNQNPFAKKKEKKVTKLNKHTEGRYRKEAGRGVKPTKK